MKRLLIIIFTTYIGLGALANPERFFNRISTSDGLASNNVYAVWQDKKGYMWIGTSNGLQRFDGKYFLYFSINKPTPLPAQPVQQILEDREGNMWIRYGDAYGIFNPADHIFKEVPIENPEIRFHGEKLWIDSKGNVFLILKRNKILFYDKTQGVFTEKNNPLRYPENYKPISIFEDLKTGFYWVGSMQGLSVFDPLKNEMYHKSYNPLNLPNLSNEEIKVVFDYTIDQHRNHWVVFWNPTQRFLAYSENLKSDIPNAMSLVNNSIEYKEMKTALNTKNGELWYYGVNSLYIYDHLTGSFSFPRNEFFRFSEIYQVFEDKEGGIWVGSDEGLYYYINDFPAIKFKNFRDASPSHLLITALEVQANKNKEVWISSWGRGIVLLDEKMEEIPNHKLYTKVPDDNAAYQPWVLIQNKNSGKVWIGNQAGWLHIIDPVTKDGDFYNFPVFKQSTIRSISQDKAGNIWFTTQRGDLIKYHADKPLVNESFELVHAFNSFSLEHVIDQKNRLWVGTSNDGVYCLDGDSGEIIKHLDNKILSTNKIEKITQLNDSIFFFGYDLLNAYNDKSGENRILSYSEGMISNDILHMLSDQDGFLWIYTPNGLCKYNYFQNSFTHYGPKDGFGLLELDGNGGILKSDGKLIFTGYHSLVEFNPREFNRSLDPDRPTLTSIKLFDNYLYVDSLNTEEKRTFKHDQNAFTFYFSTLDFIHQDKLKYFHKLPGIDEDWRSSGSSSMAVYSLIPPGNYILEFRSENEEGMSSPVGSFYFSITPPYYETWWFKSIIILLVMTVIIIIYRLNINRILDVVKVRNRVARDLHDDMGSTLSTINILSTMAKTKLHTDPVKTSEYISKISDNSQRMLEAMDDIVWSIKPQNDSMEKVIARMREFANNAMETKEIDFRFEVEENVYGLKLPMDTRRDLFLIFKEAVNNLAKYSKCSRAFIHFSIKKNQLHMRVRDYGEGFDLQEADSGNGLNNMYKRAENIGAKLVIHSEKNEGTEVILDVNL